MAGNLKIFGVNISSISYDELIDTITSSIKANKKITITYANANILNQCWKKSELINLTGSFDIIHPDGIGVYIASKFLYGKNGLRKRTSGSDFYPMLIKTAIENKWKIYLFGHDGNTLSKIKPKHPQLNVSGTSGGYNFTDEEIITAVNKAEPDILIVGLGFPKQDKWIQQNKEKLNCKVHIAVGEGIKVFAGTKIRGPRILRILGFEWFVRFLTNPFKYFSRYILGIPIFLYRIISIKMSNFKG